MQTLSKRKPTPLSQKSASPLGGREGGNKKTTPDRASLEYLPRFTPEHSAFSLMKCSCADDVRLTTKSWSESYKKQVWSLLDQEERKRIHDLFGMEFQKAVNNFAARFNGVIIPMDELDEE